MTKDFFYSLNVQVHFVVAVGLDELRAMREVRGLAAAELRADRMLGRIEGEVALDIAV